LAYTVLIITSLRGAFILFLGLPTYPLTFFSFTLLSIIILGYKSTLISFFKNPGRLSFLLKLIIINLFLGFIWLLADITYGDIIGSISTYLTYFIIPLSVFTFINLNSVKLHKIISFVSFFVAISCIIGFIIMNIFPGPPFGYEVMRIPLTQISPGGETAPISHIGSLYRSHGITGHYHDSGNLLAMSSVYLMGYIFFIRKNILIVMTTLVSIIGLITTLSTANIIVSALGIFIVAFFKIDKKIFGRFILLFLVSFSMIFIFTTYLDYDWIGVFFEQLNPSGEKMTNMAEFGTSSGLENIISIFFGHGMNSGISDLAGITEIGLISMVLNFGILLFIPVFIILAYPIYLFIKSNKNARSKMWVPFVAFCTGLISLWHYGSVFRSTNIFIFYAFSSMVFKVYLENHSPSQSFKKLVS
jgi:hypothetical protein